MFSNAEEPRRATHTADNEASQWLVLAMLVMAYAAYNLDKSILAVLIEPLKAEFALNDRQISLLTAAMAIPVAIFCIPIGRAADRMNRKHLTVFLIIGWSLMTGLSGLATSVVFLTLARCGIGAFEAGFVPTSMSILSDAFPARRRPTAMGMFGLGGPLGVCLGLAIGGFVAAQWGWRAAFFVAGVPGLLLGLLILVLVKEPRRGQFDPGIDAMQSVTFSQALGMWWQQKASIFAALGMVSGSVVLAAIATWTPSFLARTHGIGLAQAGLYSALVVGIAGSVGAASGGAVADWLGKDTHWKKLIVPVLGLLLSGATGLAGYLYTGNTATTIVILSMSAFFAQLFMGPGYATVLTLVSPQIRGTVSSILLLFFGVVSYGTGTLLVGYVSDHLADSLGQRAIAAGMASTLVFSLVGALCFWRALIHMRNPAATSTHPQK